MVQKIYPIERSPLFRLPTRKKLADLLGIEIKDLVALQGDAGYRFGSTIKKNGKPRPVQEPMGKLRKAHDQIQRYLARIEPSAYLFSGRKGYSTIRNASVHKGNECCANIDLKDFFPSTTKNAVLQFFLFQLHMNPDVARILAEICTVKGHIPTGSPLSMNLAYWAYRPTFDRIANLAHESGMAFTLWVDDLVISSNDEIPMKFILRVRRELLLGGLKWNRNKFVRYGRDEYKLITGAALSPDGKLRVTNKLRESIWEQIQDRSEFVDAASRRALIGRLTYARTLEPKIFERPYLALKAGLRLAPETQLRLETRCSN